MSKEWMSLILGMVVGGLFGGLLWLIMPETKSLDATLFYHQIGIYANAQNANNACNQLEGLGLTGYTLKKDGNSVIICGLVFSEEESQAVESTLQGAGLPILEKQEVISEDLKTAFEKEEVEALLKELESR